MKKMICILAVLLLLCGCGKDPAEQVDKLAETEAIEAPDVHSQTSPEEQEDLMPDVQSQEVRVNLMPDVRPDTSALALYIYDGQTITRRHLFEDTAYREKAIEAFCNADAVKTQVDVTTLKPPFYGIEMGAGDLGMTYGLWSDGYFMTESGETYAFDYDFEAFLKAHPWDTPEEFENLAVMPCANLVAKTENGWNIAFLTVAELPQPPEGVFLTDAIAADKAITVEFSNQSGEDWGYGYDYGLHVLLDETWYHVPAEQEMAFIEVLCMLPDGETTSETYSLEPYGRLPAGDYRLVTQGLFVDFAIQ